MSFQTASKYQNPKHYSNNAPQSWHQGPPARSTINNQPQHQAYSHPSGPSLGAPSQPGPSGLPPPPSAYWKQQASLRKGTKVEAPKADYSDVDRKCMDFSYATRVAPRTKGGTQYWNPHYEFAEETVADPQQQSEHQQFSGDHHQQQSTYQSDAPQHNQSEYQQSEYQQNASGYQQNASVQKYPEPSAHHQQQHPTYQQNQQQQPAYQETASVHHQQQSTYQPAPTQQYDYTNGYKPY